MIDAYDVLGISLDATEDDIKKGYRDCSRKNHPDKVASRGDDRDAHEKFIEIKLAHEILENAERKKIYDTFGLDLGGQTPDMEVWTLGAQYLLTPLGEFMLKTFLMRAALWIISFRCVGKILVFLTIVALVLYAIETFRDQEFTIFGNSFSMRSPNATGVLVNVVIVDVVVLLSWLWPLLSETVGVIYLISEVTGHYMFFDSWKAGVIMLLVSLVVAWLVQGWWLWIFGFEVLLAVIVLIALLICFGIVKLWVDNIQVQHGEKVREWRESMRKERKRMTEEIELLKKKLQKIKKRYLSGSGAPESRLAWCAVSSQGRINVHIATRI